MTGRKQLIQPGLRSPADLTRYGTTCFCMVAIVDRDEPCTFGLSGLVMSNRLPLQFRRWASFSVGSAPKWGHFDHLYPLEGSCWTVCQG
jgi:hypothetical protein